MSELRIQQGDSISIMLIFPQDRMNKLVDFSVYLDNREIATKANATAGTSINSYVVKVLSSDTQKLQGFKHIVVACNYSDLGVRKMSNENSLKIFVINNINRYDKQTSSTIVDATINIAIVDNNVLSTVYLASIYRGYSTFEIAQQNGFTGTVEEWLDSLRLPVPTVPAWSSVSW